MTGIDRRQELKNDYLAAFGTEAGRRVLRDLLAQCHLFRPSFVVGKADLTAFKEGERNVGLRILTLMNIQTHEELQQYAEME